jgi:hypothetical protein
MHKMLAATAYAASFSARAEEHVVHAATDII